MTDMINEYDYSGLVIEYGKLRVYLNHEQAMEFIHKVLDPCKDEKVFEQEQEMDEFDKEWQESDANQHFLSYQELDNVNP